MKTINIYQLAAMTDSDFIKLVANGQDYYSDDYAKTAAITRFKSLQPKANKPKPKKRKKAPIAKKKPWYLIF